MRELVYDERFDEGTTTAAQMVEIPGVPGTWPAENGSRVGRYTGIVRVLAENLRNAEPADRAQLVGAYGDVEEIVANANHLGRVEDSEQAHTAALYEDIARTAISGIREELDAATEISDGSSYLRQGLGTRLHPLQQIYTGVIGLARDRAHMGQRASAEDTYLPAAQAEDARSLVYYLSPR